MLHLGIALWLLANTPQEPEILFEGIGSHTRSIETRSDTARRFFNQGLNFMYAFNHGEAKRSFRAATRLDPDCAMAWWGLAMANGPHINNMEVAPEEEKEAVGALQRAMNSMSTESPVNRALIRATLSRFRYPQPKDRGPLNVAFGKEMRKVWQRFPQDADAGALFAESLMDLWPWDLWTRDGKPQPDTLEILRTLEAVLRQNPNHPLGLHLYIHAVEAGPNPEKAAEAADRLRDLQPALGHNVHMPSHIDVRVGAWEKAIVANQKAIAADKAYRERRPNQTIYRLYMAHNHHMLAFAAMMVGKSELAIREIDDMIAGVPEEFREAVAPFMDGFFSMPYEVRVRFGKWDEVLALPDLPEIFPLSRALRHQARAVSFAAKGMTREARAEQAMFYAARARVPKQARFGQNSAADIMRVAHHLMNGEMLVAEARESAEKMSAASNGKRSPAGEKVEAALRELRLAVDAEDALRYGEPPDWILPSRHVLSALLVSLRRFPEAEQVYRRDLQKLPNNGWSLYGLSVALAGQGNARASAVAKQRFDKVWENADLRIDTSCLCIPGR